MTLIEFLIIVIGFGICGLMGILVSVKYPPKLPQLTTYIPAELIVIKLVDCDLYRYEDVRYIQDEKNFKIYLEDNTKIIFPLDVIVYIKIVTEENNITKCITK